MCPSLWGDTQPCRLVGRRIAQATVNVLMSLGNDPQPVVHYWALSVLSQVIAARLTYSPFISSTLVVPSKLYTLDPHESEAPNERQSKR